MTLALTAHLVPELLRRVTMMLDQGRPGAARPLLNAVLRSAPQSAETMVLEARLLDSEGHCSESLALLDLAVENFPCTVLPRLSRASARIKAGDPAGAATDAAEAVLLEPGLARAQALLGAALLDLGQFADARTCLVDAIRADPADTGYRQALAHAQEACGDVRGAAENLAKAIALRPDHVGFRTSAILLQIRSGEFAKAESLAEAARSCGVVDACVFGLLGHARSSLGQHAAAAEAYEEARKLAAEDPYVRHLAAAAGLSRGTARAAPEYVRAVFDGYAPRFNAHLIELGYRVPGLIRRELASLALRNRVAEPVLDLGCGTGLLAVAAADLITGKLIGVDLSGRMLAEAERHGLYAELHQQDAEEFLNQDGRMFGTVLAGDVLPYFGDLTNILQSVAEHLVSGGHFVFSLETLSDTEPLQDWRLGRMGRYAHTPEHVKSIAASAGFSVRKLRREVVRSEAGGPVPGLLVVLERTVG